MRRTKATLIYRCIKNRKRVLKALLPEAVQMSSIA